MNKAIEFYNKLKADPECCCGFKAKTLQALSLHFRSYHGVIFSEWLFVVNPNHCRNCGKKIPMRPGDASVAYRVNFCSLECSSAGEFNPRYGIKLPEELKAKISKGRRGVKMPESFRLKMIELCKSPERRARMQQMSREFHATGTHPNVGRKFSTEVRRKMAEGRRKKWESGWDGRFSKFCRMVRSCMHHVWVRPIMARDGFACCRCGVQGVLSVHHIVPFRDIVLEVLRKNPELNLMNNSDRWILHDKCLAYPPLLDFSNGITLCRECRRKEHRFLKAA